MERPQFAERQYEAAVHIELARGRATPFVPTQNAEMYLGIDAAADPGKVHAIWRILGVQVPRRIPLAPSLWPALPQRFHEEISGRYCSLFLQFKRPLFQDHRRAKYYRRLGGPYFEVGITAHQQKALSSLERRVTARAVVRYASAAFWSRQDFDRFDDQRVILANSAFIAPNQVKSHQKWMYAGVTGTVVLNPVPEEAVPQNWDVVAGALESVAVRQSLRQHVRSIAAALGAVEEPHVTESDAPWLARVRRYGRLSKEDAGFITDLSVVVRAADDAEAVWLVLLIPDEEWSRWFQQDRESWWWPYRWW
jgi:hypothetical protein